MEYTYSENINKEKDKEIVSAIEKIIDNHSSEKSKISVMGVGRTTTKKGYDANQVYLAGGLNGNGVWSDYLDDLASIVRDIEQEFSEKAENVVLVNMEMDLADDIFYPVLDIVYSYEEEE